MVHANFFLWFLILDYGNAVFVWCFCIWVLSFKVFDQWKFVPVPFGFACKRFYLSNFYLHFVFLSICLRFCAGKVVSFVGYILDLKPGLICLFGLSCREVHGF